MKEDNFLVFGTGLSGVAAAELLIKEKKRVTLYDGKETLDLGELRQKNPALSEIPVLLGRELTGEMLPEFDVAVLSPGVPTDLPLVEEMRRAHLTIWGEVELAYRYGKGRVLAITGTNGKTTTTTLLGEIMRAAFADVRVVGNIGNPYTREVLSTTEDSVIVAEISSFQLETTDSFCPKISAILNITPDHLNRHHTMENYVETKKRIAGRQTASQLCVLNYEDERLRRFGEQLSGNPERARVLFFSSARTLEQGVYLEGDTICFRRGDSLQKVCGIRELQIIGKHNYENVMAAVAMAAEFGVPMDIIRRVVTGFQAVEHRIEYVTAKRGVRFFNDSKGTNPDAAIQAVRAMEWPTLLIGGGYDKESEFDSWIQAFDGRVKKLVLLGQTRDKIRETAERCGFPREDIILVDSLQEAVDVCYANAKSGDAVLLSPACASWGMFDNYEQRGNLFKEMARELKE